ncbi:MAG: alpha/beta fold hydrolase [Pseudonocardia sp.]
MVGNALHLRTYGPEHGPAVLALHGVTGHSARWRVLAEALPELRLLAVDLRGHGHSPWTPPWNIEQHVADALAVLDDLGLERVAAIGHSYGGAIAVHLAQAAPERVERLVLLDPAMGLSPRDMLRTAEGCRADETFSDLAVARADRAIRWTGISDELVQAELAEHLIPDGDRWRYRYCPSAVVTAWGEMARPARTPPAGMPTLLIPAIRSAFVHPRWVRECRRELGDALVVAEIDAGHMIFLECTAEVADLIRPFLGR